MSTTPKQSRKKNGAAVGLKNALLEQLGRIRILETSFPVYSQEGRLIGRKCHLLLTYTPKEIPIADEEYALNLPQMQDLFDNIYKYVLTRR